jgi:nucleoside-diphosphate-sugar epimerase
MRVIVLGGTRFIGRAIVDALVAGGHDALVCHRGAIEPDGLPPVVHLHTERGELIEHRRQLDAFAADAVIDCLAMSASDARAMLTALPDPELHRIVLSSQDVYRAFATVQRNGLATDPVPITEGAPLREDRYPSRDEEGYEDYSKLDVEEAVLAAGATVLRLPMVFGPHDYQRREEFVLKRVRAGRPRIPVGAANALLPLALVDDVARGVVAAVEHQGRGASVYNFAPARTDPMSLWMQRILKAADSAADLVRVPDGTVLPADLGLTVAFSQPLVISSVKARDELGYKDTDPDEAVGRSVQWHLDHPPKDASGDFSADDLALETASGADSI